MLKQLKKYLDTATAKFQNTKFKNKERKSR